jgi:dethiobiotin synthetase
MAKSIFITATNTDIGKTYTTVKLIEQLSSQGLKVCAYKPIETGVVGGHASDASVLLEAVQANNPLFLDLKIDDIISYKFELPSAPYVAKGDVNISLEKIKKQKEYLESICDVLLIEGAGGLFVPIEKDFFMIDLIDYLEVDKTLLVTSSKLGAINSTILSQNALKQRDIKFDWLVNIYKDQDSFFDVTYPFYQDYFDKIATLDKDIESISNSLIS